MTDSYLTQIILPLVLALIMFGMGLSLTKQDFLELGKEPKPIVLGLFGQLLLLPFLAYGVAILIAVSFLDRPDYAIAAGVYGLAMYLGAGILIFGAKHFPSKANS